MEESLVWKLSSQGTWGHYWFGQFHSNLSVHPDPNTLEAFPHQPFCPNIHKCFGTSVRVTGPLDQKGKFQLIRLTPIEFNQRSGNGGEGLGKPANPKVFSGKARKYGSFAGIFTSSRVGNETQNLE